MRRKGVSDGLRLAHRRTRGRAHPKSTGLSVDTWPRPSNRTLGTCKNTLCGASCVPMPFWCLCRCRCRCCCQCACTCACACICAARVWAEKVNSRKTLEGTRLSNPWGIADVATRDHRAPHYPAGSPEHPFILPFHPWFPHIICVMNDPEP